jgi:hypothetical protein
VKYPICPPELSLEGGAQLLIESPISLEAAELLQASCDTERAIVYHVNGTKIPAIPSASERAQ